MQHELNSDGYRNREYRPYILGEDTTFNTVMYDPNRSYVSSLYISDYQTLQPYEDNVNQYFNLPRAQAPDIRPRAVPGEGAQYNLHSPAHSQRVATTSFSPTNRGTQGSYALLYTT